MKTGTTIGACGALVAICMALTSDSARGHAVRYRVSTGEAVVITLTHDDGSPFAFQTDPFQAGRSDRRGCVVFAPAGSTRWELRAFSIDGHGVMVRGTTSGHSGEETSSRRVGRASGVIAGAGVLLAIFGVTSLAMARRMSTTSRVAR